MSGQIWGTRQLDPYHDDMLAIRVHGSAGDPMRRMLRNRHGHERAAPGLSALTALEAAGLLDHIVPLGPEARRRAGRSRRVGSVGAAVLAAALEYHEDRTHTGTMLVDLKHVRHKRGLAQALARDPHITQVWPVPRRYLWAARKPSPAGLLPAPRHWNHGAIELEQARALKRFKEPRNIRVAVLDSGVDETHPDLAGRIHAYVHQFGHRHRVPLSGRDIVGHGTHVAGIIAAQPSHDMNVDGICHPELTVFKVFTEELIDVPADGARIYTVDPILYRWALGECLDRRIDVINMSLGGPAPPTGVEASLLQSLLDRGTVIVSAMGNSFTDHYQKSYPAAWPGVIAVGATGLDDTIAPFSKRGAHVALCAPGVAIWSTLPRYPGQFGFTLPPGARTARGGAKRVPVARNTLYDAWPGTSMACPHVAAAVALLMARRGRMSAAQVRKRLMATADKVPGMKGKSYDTTYGAGRLNLRRLLGP